MSTPRPTPTRFHFPAWELTLNQTANDRPDAEIVAHDYIVWGPGPITHQGRPAEDGKTRDYWAASWQINTAHPRGNYRRGDSLDAVLAIFPASIAAAFHAVITDWQTSTDQETDR